MASFHARNGAGELLARYSFVEPLLSGRRVLEVGGAAATEGASALFLAERGAAAVLSIEPDVTAVLAGGPGLADLAGEPPAAEPPPYEAFVNALADHFPLVEVAAQSATVG